MIENITLKAITFFYNKMDNVRELSILSFLHLLTDIFQGKYLRCIAFKINLESLEDEKNG